jgi:hypothetical protein
MRQTSHEEGFVPRNLKQPVAANAAESLRLARRYLAFPTIRTDDITLAPSCMERYRPAATFDHRPIRRPNNLDFQNVSWNRDRILTKCEYRVVRLGPENSVPGASAYTTPLVLDQTSPLFGCHLTNPPTESRGRLCQLFPNYCERGHRTEWGHIGVTKSS